MKKIVLLVTVISLLALAGCGTTEKGKSSETCPIALTGDAAPVCTGK